MEKYRLCGLLAELQTREFFLRSGNERVSNPVFVQGLVTAKKIIIGDFHRRTNLLCSPQGWVSWTSTRCDGASVMTGSFSDTTALPMVLAPNQVAQDRVVDMG